MPTLFRSVLFVPGTRGDRFDKALAADADAVILDLEDSVDPGRKTEARETVARFLATRPVSSSRLFVRVNASTSPWIGADLERMRGLEGFDGLVLPKVESPHQIETVAPHAPARCVIPLLESARGILHAAAIAAADADVPALLFGAEDLTADLGIRRTIDGEELLFARSQVVLAAASVGAEAIDAVATDLADIDGLRADAHRARALGFRGKMAIHPAQVPVINEVYSPTADEIAHARQTIAAFDAAGPAGVIRVNDQMIEAPVVLRAKRVLALADAIAGRPATSRRTPS
ncbi:MAG TPA: CoA ester lyase [Vicinamibacterales bacterium]|nr:CoA ester lyase [Vicinamibacterales bacterium]